MDFNSFGESFGQQEDVAQRDSCSRAVLAAAHPLFALHAPAVISDKSVAEALAADSVSRRVMSKNRRPSIGDYVGVRLNLNILKSKGVTVQTLHAGSPNGRHALGRGFYGGDVLDYRKIVTLTDAYFNVSQAARERICAGRESKHPMASVDGVLARSPVDVFRGVEIRFNPYDVHLFVDMAGRPVRRASEVTIYGHRAYARGTIEYFTPSSAPARAGDAPSAVVFAI